MGKSDGGSALAALSDFEIKRRGVDTARSFLSTVSDFRQAVAFRTSIMSRVLLTVGWSVPNSPPTKLRCFVARGFNVIESLFDQFAQRVECGVGVDTGR